MTEIAVFISSVWLLKLKDGPCIQSGLPIFVDLEMTRSHRIASSLCGNQVHTKLASNEWEWGGPAIFKTCANAYVRSAFFSLVSKFLAEFTYDFRFLLCPLTFSGIWTARKSVFLKIGFS